MDWFTLRLISQLFHPLCNQLPEFNSGCLKYLEELLSFCFLTSKSLPPWSKATTVCHSDNGLPAIVFVYQYNSQRMLLKSKLDSVILCSDSSDFPSHTEREPKSSLCLLGATWCCCLCDLISCTLFLFYLLLSWGSPCCTIDVPSLRASAFAVPLVENLFLKIP